jgi:transcription elongation factor GreA
MTNYLTKEGLAELQAELKQILEIKLPEVLESINRARAEGDISENAALDSANFERDKLVARQAEIEESLMNYEIIEDSTTPSNTVKIGSLVKLVYSSTNQEFTLKIVGSSEADAIAGKISNESPLAQAILGKKEGQEASFKSKLGKMSVKILQIVA